MPQTNLFGIPLTGLSVGASARISEIKGGRDVARRLLGLGLRVGSNIKVVQRQGRGIVVATTDTRVALGGSVAVNVLTRPIEDQRA